MQNLYTTNCILEQQKDQDKINCNCTTVSRVCKFYSVKIAACANIWLCYVKVKRNSAKMLKFVCAVFMTAPLRCKQHASFMDELPCAKSLFAF